jgi:hypothetical protein
MAVGQLKDGSSVPTCCRICSTAKTLSCWSIWAIRTKGWGANPGPLNFIYFLIFTTLPLSHSGSPKSNLNTELKDDFLKFQQLFEVRSDSSSSGQNQKTEGKIIGENFNSISKSVHPTFKRGLKKFSRSLWVLKLRKLMQR